MDQEKNRPLLRKFRAGAQIAAAVTGAFRALFQAPHVRLCGRRTSFALRKTRETNFLISLGNRWLRE